MNDYIPYTQIIEVFPIKKGDVLGEVEIYVGEEKMGGIPLTASKDIDKISFLTTMGWILKSLFIL